jgi:TPR repeat protein
MSTLLKTLFISLFVIAGFSACSSKQVSFESKKEKDEVASCQKIVAKNDKVKCYEALSTTNSIAQLKLGVLNATYKKYDKAFKLFTDSKNQGNYYANLPLAYLYFRGNGVAKDADKSLSLLKDASNKDANAAFQLSNFYFKGLGIAKNITKGLKVLELAASKNMFAAQKKLALIYAQGLYGINKDKIKSKVWQEKANNNKTDKTFNI